MAPRAGFTLIELVVVLVVAIPAAVAIPVYVEIQANAKSAIVGYRTDNQSLPGAINAAALGAYGCRTTTEW